MKWTKRKLKPFRNEGVLQKPVAHGNYFRTFTLPLASSQKPRGPVYMKFHAGFVKLEKSFY